MKKLKTLLQYKYLYYIILSFSLLYCVFYINFIDIKTSNSKYVKGIVIFKNDDGNKLTMHIKNKKKVLVNYYFKNDNEIKKLNLKYGDYIKIIGTKDELKNNSVFNLFNYKKYLYSNRIYSSYTANKIIKIKNNHNLIFDLKNKISERINKCKKTKNYIRTFIIGEKNNINYEIKEEYQKLGISHLFSISGMHIGLISGFILFFLKNTNKIFKYVVVDLILIFFMIITNFSPSVIRTVLIFILLSINKLFKLNIKTNYLILFLLSILLIFNPYFIYNIGFVFSFTICFFLVSFSDSINNYNNYFKKMLYVSFLSFLISIPILINNFYQISLLSVIYNIIYIPFVTFIVFPFGIITFIFPFLDNYFFIVINFLEKMTLYFSKYNIILYFSKQNIFLIIIYYILLYINVYYPSFKKKVLLIVLLFFFYFNNYYCKTNITFIDVSQGDSILYRFSNKNILIDTGGKIIYQKKNKNQSLFSNTIFPYLKSVGVKKLDYLILSHGDYDHMGEAINLVNNFQVEKVIFNCGPYNDLEQELIKVLNKKKIKYYSCIKELNIDKNKLYFLQTKEYNNENDNSNVIYTELDGYKFMFMGDASITTEKEIIDKYNLPNIDVLKVGHHGSKTSSGKNFINEINPKYSIISVGKNNRYGHPNKEVLENLQDSKIYRTDQDGSIMFKIKNNKLKIETCSP